MSSDQSKPSEDKVKGNGTEADANTNPMPPITPPAPATRPVCYTPDPANADATSHRHKGVSAERGLGGLLIIVFTGIVAACTIIEGFIVYFQLGSMNSQLVAMRDQNTEMGKQSTQMSKQSGLMTSQLCAMGEQNYVLIDQTKEMIEQTKQAKVSADAATTAANAAKASVGLAGEANATAERAAKAANHAALAAVHSNDIAEDNSRKQLRCYMSLFDVGSRDLGNGNFQFSIRSKNLGHTFARNVVVHSNVFVKVHPYAGKFDFSMLPADRHISKVAMGPESEFVHKKEHTINRVDTGRIESGELVIYFYGEVLYDDIYGASHWTTFRCIAGGNSGAPVGGMIFASEGNETDDN